MKNDSKKILGIFALLTLFLALQPAFFLATFIDTSDDSDSTVSGLELRANSFHSKRVLTKDLLPALFNPALLSSNDTLVSYIFSTKLYDNTAHTDSLAKVAINNIRGPPIVCV